MINPWGIQTKPARNAEHLDYVRNNRCLICGDNITVQAAHFSMPYAALGKGLKGTGNKSRGPNGEECYTYPLCSRHHDRQHEIGETKFLCDWGYSELEIIAKCQALWICSGDMELGDMIISNRCKR